MDGAKVGERSSMRGCCKTECAQRPPGRSIYKGVGRSPTFILLSIRQSSTLTASFRSLQLHPSTGLLQRLTHLVFCLPLSGQLTTMKFFNASFAALVLATTAFAAPYDEQLEARNIEKRATCVYNDYTYRCLRPTTQGTPSTPAPTTPADNPAPAPTNGEGTSTGGRSSYTRGSTANDSKSYPPLLPTQTKLTPPPPFSRRQQRLHPPNGHFRARHWRTRQRGHHRRPPNVPRTALDPRRRRRHVPRRRLPRLELWKFQLRPAGQQRDGRARCHAVAPLSQHAYCTFRVLAGRLCCA